MDVPKTSCRAAWSKDCFKNSTGQLLHTRMAQELHARMEKETSGFWTFSHLS